MRAFIIALLTALMAGALFGIIYPSVRGEAANSPNDRLGEILGTVLIPAVFGMTYGLCLYLENRRRG